MEQPRTKKQLILDLLGDCEWHDSRSLNAICFAYSQRIGDLKREEWEFDTMHDGAHWFWKLTGRPKVEYQVVDSEGQQAFL